MIGAAAGLAALVGFSVIFAPHIAMPLIAAGLFAAILTCLPLVFELFRGRPLPVVDTPVAANSNDPLTNTLNRGAFMRRMDDVLLGEKPEEPATGALLLVKANHMRAINDGFGVDTGDDVLCALASTIRASVRRSDFVGRIGSGQFGVFLRRAAPNDAAKIADRIRRNISQLTLADELQLTVSVGGAIFAAQMDTDEVLRIAGESLDTARDDADGAIEMIYLPKDGDRVLIAGAIH